MMNSIATCKQQEPLITRTKQIVLVCHSIVNVNHESSLFPGIYNLIIPQKKKTLENRLKKVTLLIQKQLL